MQIKTIVVTPFSQNARVIVNTDTLESYIVDPGGDIEKIMKFVTEGGFTVRGIILTHSHIDHAGGVHELVEWLPGKLGLDFELLGHRDESNWRQGLPQQALMFGLSPKEYPPCPEPTRYLVGGEEIELLGERVNVLFTPGHSPGHLSFFFGEQSPPVLISGDALFQGSIGRTDLPGGNHQTLINSIRREIFSLPDSTVVMSGHGPDTTVGIEKRENPFLN